MYIAYAVRGFVHILARPPPFTAQKDRCLNVREGRFLSPHLGAGLSHWSETPFRKRDGFAGSKPAPATKPKIYVFWLWMVSLSGVPNSNKGFYKLAPDTA
jgi:hypothetical protein